MTSTLQVTDSEASMSSTLRIGDEGVVQGSLCRPLWYAFFTSELPEVVHGKNCTIEAENENLNEPPRNFEIFSFQNMLPINAFIRVAFLFF